MSDEQVGKYIRLLCLQHQKNELTEKDMIYICKTYDEDVFGKFTKTEEGKYYNQRLREEMEKRRKYSESRSNNRKSKPGKGEQPPAGVPVVPQTGTDMKNICSTYVQHMGNENENENSSIVIYQPKRLYEEFMASQQWQENILRSTYAKGLTPELLKSQIITFIQLLRDKGEMTQTLGEYRRYFINWLQKNIKANPVQSPTKPVKNAKQIASEIDSRGY